MRNVIVSFVLGTTATLLAAVLIAPQALAQSEAEKLYKGKCAMCHSPDGSGNNPMGKAFKAKDLRSDEVQKQTDAQLTEIITKGKPPKMPAYGEKLKDTEIKDLVAYIRGLGK
jgi:mono/diheme cytochrome c family protein